MSPDAVTIHGLGSDPNPYAYVYGSPLMGVDPDGNIPRIISSIIAKAVPILWMGEAATHAGINLITTGSPGLGGLGNQVLAAQIGGGVGFATSLVAGPVVGGIVGGAAGGAASAYLAGGSAKSVAISAGMGAAIGGATAGLGSGLSEAGAGVYGSVAVSIAGGAASYALTQAVHGDSVTAGGCAKALVGALPGIGSSIAMAQMSEGPDGALPHWNACSSGAPEKAIPGEYLSENPNKDGLYSLSARAGAYSPRCKRLTDLTLIGVRFVLLTPSTTRTPWETKEQ